MYKDNCDYEISSIKEFLELIDDLAKELSAINPSKLWFRAENEKYSDTHLIPSFYRDFINEKPELKKELIINENGLKTVSLLEENLKSRFKTSGASYTEFSNYLDYGWNQYYLMQHYGISTRLLDWSESALISLFFAVEKECFKGNGDKYDAVLWVLNPYVLNHYSLPIKINNPNNIQYVYTPHIPSDHLHYINEELNKYLKINAVKFHPVAILPTWFDMRMKNQKSCFTIFGCRVNGLLFHPDKDKFLKKIVIKSESFELIKRELINLGVSYETIYPGLDGVGKDTMYRTKFL